VYFGPAHRQAGTLEDVSERGIVVWSTREDMENVFWYPLPSVTRLLKGRPQGGKYPHTESLVFIPQICSEGFRLRS
jgi:hypothetical protein